VEKRHILVVSQYFYPEQFRVNDICQEWIARGYKVTVLTGIPNYPQGKYYKGYNFFSSGRETFEEIDVVRIPLVARGSRPITLAMNYFSFVVSGWLWKLFTKLNPDCVFIYEVSPMTQALPGVWFAKKKNIPCYLYVTDLWPEGVEEITGFKHPFIIKPLEKMVKYIYSNCDKIFTSSKSFIDSIAERGISRQKLKFWPQYAENFYKKVEPKANEIFDNGNFQITFAGNIGESQGLEILPVVAKMVKAAKLNVQFNIIGGGRAKEKFQRKVREQQVAQYFNFVDKKLPEEIPYYFANSDAVFISLRKSELLKRTIPAKVPSCMACEMPILASADGEIQTIVREASCGLSSMAGDAEGLFQNIKKMLSMESQDLIRLGENAFKYYQANFDKKFLMDVMDNYLGGGDV